MYIHSYIRNNKDVDFSGVDVNLFTATLGKWQYLSHLPPPHSLSLISHSPLP